MKLALAHDYLIQMGGGERVVAAMHTAYPEAPIYTSAVDRRRLFDAFQNADIRTSWMQSLPFITHHTHFKKYFALYPLAFRSIRPAEADIAWISCSTFAKFLKFPPATRTVCYLHNTTRFLWQTDDYLDYEVTPGTTNSLVRRFLPALREADRDATAAMDVLIANSENVRQRIRRCYSLNAVVINPPVEIQRFTVSTQDDGYYLIVSRLLGYKQIDLAIRAFNANGKRLVIVGNGPYLSNLRTIAGKTIEFAGRLSDDAITGHYSRCRALILPGEEDFGITPVEAMACGKPVIAFGRGGALETVLDAETGLFFHEPSVESLLDAIDRCESSAWNPDAIRRHSLRFSREAFLEKTRNLLAKTLA